MAIVDFAGSSVVHMTGGITALAGAICSDRASEIFAATANWRLPGHNIPMAIVGTLILAFGWFGFNTGSTLAASDPRIGLIAANTMIASAGGALSALLYLWFRFHKPDIAMACNGLLGGLVAITGALRLRHACSRGDDRCDRGLVGGRRCLFSSGISGSTIRSARFRCTEYVASGARSRSEFFADGSYGDGWNGVAGPVRGLLYGDAGQFFAQLIGVSVNIVVVFGLAWLFFMIVERTIGNRVTAEIECSGLDALEMGSDAYPHS